MRLVLRNPEIVIKICKLDFCQHNKEKKHILRKKALKNTFPQQKTTMDEKKAQKKTLLFFKNTCWEDCNSNDISALFDNLFGSGNG